MPPDKPPLFSRARFVAFLKQLGWFTLIVGVPILLLALVLSYTAFIAGNDP